MEGMVCSANTEPLSWACWGFQGQDPGPDSPGAHDSSLVGRLKKIDNCKFQKQNKQAKKAFVAMLSHGDTWMINEAKTIAYFALL